MNRYSMSGWSGKRLQRSGVSSGMTALLTGLVLTSAWASTAVAQKAEPKKATPTLQKRTLAPGRAKGTNPKVEVKPASVQAQQKASKLDPNAPRPVIKPDTDVYDFGTTWIGPKLEHTFKITNTGNAVLDILRVKPACGCTAVKGYPKKLAPGETGSFGFSIASTKLRGNYKKAITITSNDPVNSNIRLSLKGECKRYVDVMPLSANFGRIFGTEKQERVLKVTNNTDKPIEVELDAPKDSKFGFELLEIEKGNKWEIHVSTSGSDKPGSIRATATLKTNVEQQKEVRLIASATVPKRIDVVPPQITMVPPTAGAKPATKPITRIVRVANYGQTPAKVLEATVDDPKIKATIKESAPGKNYEIKVEFPADYKLPATGRTLTLKMDDKAMPSIAVPIKSRATRTANRPKPKRGPELMVGQTAPSFNGSTIEGKAVNNDTAKEAITVLDFFAGNCPHCIKQLPRVEKMRQQYEAKGVRFVAVSQTMRNKKFTKEEILAKLGKAQFKGEVITDPDNKIGPGFKATSYPSMVILDKTGKVAAANLGNIGDLEKRMKGQLDALIAGKPVPVYTAKAAPPRQRPAETMKGKVAPSFSLSTIDGKALSSADFAKHPATVLNFVSPNCGFCKRQAPNVEKVRKSYEEKGVRFVAMSMKMGAGLNRATKAPWTPQEIVDVFKKAGSNLEVAIDEGNAIGKQYKAGSFPTMMVVGKDGKIAHVNVGAKAGLDKILSGQLDGLIKAAKGAGTK